MDAAAEEGLFREGLDEDDAGRDEDGILAFGVGDGDFDERLSVILRGAFEAQAAFGHVLASDDVVAAFGMADASGVADLDARMLAAVDTRWRGRSSLRGRRGAFWGWRRQGEDSGDGLGGRVAEPGDGGVSGEAGVGATGSKV